MKEYLFLIHGTGYRDESPEALKSHIEKYQNWVEKLSAEGKYIMGNRLANSGNAVIDAKNIISDGPYLESKEIVGGYILIKASSLEEATSLAKSCPLAEDCVISVRPMYEWPEL